MCVKNAMELTLKSDTFSALKEDFDSILARTIGNMQMKGAEDATITLKLSVSLENTNAVIRGENEDITRPSFKHDISSVMQVKDKKSGALTGDYQLVWDDDEGKYVMKRIDNGQMTLFDDDGNVIEGNAEVIDAEYREVPELPAPDEDDELRTPFGWLKQFIGEELKITEAMGNYTARTANDKVILSSAFVEDSPFHCDAEILSAHIDHSIACVGYGDDEIVNVSIECEDCNEVIFGLDKPIVETVETEGDAESEGVPAEDVPTDDELMENVADEEAGNEEDATVEGPTEDDEEYEYATPDDDDLADL